MAKIDVVMPKMGESVMEGTVLTWFKQPGDAVEMDETLLEIGTDKVDSEIPSPAEGVLVEILVPEGETVDVGTVLARLETEAEASGDTAPASAPPEAEPEPETVPAAEEPEPEPEPEREVKSEREAESEPEPEAEPKGAPVAAEGAEITDVVMPKMGESVMEGTVLTWFKQPGDAVEMDETLLEIGTDKVDSEIPSPAEGVLVEILVPEGETVDVGTVLARLASEATAGRAAPAPSGQDAGSRAESAAESVAEEPAPETDTEPSSEAPSPPAAASATAASGEAIPRRDAEGRFYSPLVRSIAEEEGVSLEELAEIEGSGKDGRVTKKDILAFIEQRKSRPAAPKARPEARPEARPAAPRAAGDRVEVVEMDRMRQIIAEHMMRSISTSAHVTTFAEADVTNLVRLREARKEEFERREGVRLTYTPFFVQASVEALRAHPYVNASIEGKQVLLRQDFHVGIAVAVGQAGLVVPVIRNAGTMNVRGLAHAAASLAERARNKQLQPDDLQGGTFTVTNVGSLGSLIGTPIINQPQLAILATGAIKKRPVVVEDPELGDVIAIRHMMYLSLTYDHRLIDGAMGSSFIQTVVRHLESIDPNGEV